MMTAKIKLAIALALLAAAVSGFLMLRSYYVGVGVDRERGRRTSADLRALSDMLEAHKGLIQAANLASGEMNAALAKRTRADSEITRSMKNALAKTAGNRRDCRFDAASLQHLDDARERAAQAAASGIRDSAATTAGALGRQSR
jgi:hypothetical protein